MQRKGYLDVLPLLGSGNKRSQKLWVVLNPKGEGGVTLDQYDSEYFETAGSLRCSVLLKNCYRIEALRSTHEFELDSNNASFRFGCNSCENADEWVENIKRAVAQERTKSALGLLPDLSFSASVAQGGSPASSKTFSVTLKQNQVAKRLKLTGQYNLCVSPKHISLYEEQSGTRVATWMYEQLRKYTAYKDRFEIEAGRKAETGPGVYIFISPQAQEISQLLTSNIKIIDDKLKRLKSNFTDHIDNPNYTQLPARDNKKVPFNPNENPTYVDDPDAMTHHLELSVPSTGTSSCTNSSTDSDHDHEEVEILRSSARQCSKPGYLYARVGDLIDTVQAPTVTQPNGECSNPGTTLRPPNEKIYAKVNKPKKTLATEKENVANHLDVEEVQSVDCVRRQENHKVLVMEPNPSYGKISCAGEDTIGENRAAEVDNLSSSPADMPADDKFAEQFKEIDRMWNEAWNT